MQLDLGDFERLYIDDAKVTVTFEPVRTIRSGLTPLRSSIRS